MRGKLRDRVERQKAFFASDLPGEMLLYGQVWRLPSLSGYLARALEDGSPAELLRPDALSRLTGAFLAEFRSELDAFYSLGDDALPVVGVYAGIGSITGAMTGAPVTAVSGTTWCEAGLDLEQAATLQLDADNPWVRLAVAANRALWDAWDEDFLVTPYYHRAPLDAATGVRGWELFEDLHGDPVGCRRVLERCSEWSLRMEELLGDEAPPPTPGGCGAWCTWLPDGGVFVNGDAVDLVSPSMAAEFDAPYTSRFFENTGGGFFHHHALGLHQVETVARTRGLWVQEVITDPGVTSPADAMLQDETVRERLIAASLVAPVMLQRVAPETLAALRPVLKRGRFIVSLDTTDPEVFRRIRR